MITRDTAPPAAWLGPVPLSDLIGGIYDCALDPGLWPSLLARLSDALRFEHAALTMTALPSGNVLLNITSGIDDA